LDMGLTGHRGRQPAATVDMAGGVAAAVAEAIAAAVAIAVARSPSRGTGGAGTGP